MPPKHRWEEGSYEPVSCCQLPGIRQAIHEKLKINESVYNLAREVLISIQHAVNSRRRSICSIFFQQEKIRSYLSHTKASIYEASRSHEDGIEQDPQHFLPNSHILPKSGKADRPSLLPQPHDRASYLPSPIQSSAALHNSLPVVRTPSSI